MAYSLTSPSIGNTNWGSALNNNWSQLSNGMLFPNLLINGNFDIWQRAITIGGTPGYVADRWKFTFAGGGGGATCSQVSTGLPTNNCQYAISLIASFGTTTTTELGQQIEFADFKAVLGKTVTISFWAQAAASDAASKALTVLYRINTSSIDIQTVLTGAATTIASPTLSTSWLYYSYSFTLPSNALSFAIGFANQTALAINDGFYISQVQLEFGNASSPFQFMPINQIIALCCRFYEKSFSLTTIPAANIQANAICTNCTNGGFSNSYASAVTYKVTKRAIPTITFFNPRAVSNGTWTFYSGGTATSVTPTIEVQGTNSFSALAAGTATYSLVYLHYTADCDF